MKKHLTTDELVDALYGIGQTGVTGHLKECGDCSARLERLLERKATVAEPVLASHDFLAAQRRNVYARMGERGGSRMKWAPAWAAAACCAVALSVLAHHPQAQAPAPAAKPEQTDAQLFSDIYSMEQSMEPIAAKPIHAMFEQDSQ